MSLPADYDRWKTRSDLDDWAAQNHNPPDEEEEMQERPHQPKRIVIDRKLEYAVLHAIEEVCHLGEDGFAHYDEGESDETILKRFPAGATINHIKAIRLNGIGKLRAHRPGTQKEALGDLEARLTRLEAWAARQPVPFMPAPSLFE
jgi:hypothetical protein